MKNVLSILLVFLLLQGEAFARTSGRSFSSGSSSSFGRSYSSGSHTSSFGKSYSSPSSHSYSSGGSSTTRSYTSGGNSSPRSYSAGASSSPKSYSSSPASRVQSFGGSSSSPVGKSYSSAGSYTGKSYSSAGGNSFLGKSATAPKGNFNSALTSAGRQEDSRIAYQKTYTTPKGVTKTYTPADHIQADRIRSVDATRYRNYDNRVQIFYGNTQPYYYNDYWSPFLTGYLLSSAVNSFDRASWVYNHRYGMDDARYQYLLAQDAGLSAQIRQLESQNVQRDPNYVLPAMANDPDLMYSKGFVDSARQQAPSGTFVVASSRPQGPSVWSVAFWTLFTAGVIGAAVWLVFIREW